MAMSSLQRYPWNLYKIQNVEYRRVSYLESVYFCEFLNYFF